MAKKRRSHELEQNQDDVVSYEGDHGQDLSNIPSPSPSAFTIVTRPDPNEEVAQRLWAEDDEVSLLDGLARFGSDPNSDPGGFYEFVKPMLSVEVTRNQVMDKVKRLKKKYKRKLKKGGTGNWSEPLEVKAFELSNKIWGPTKEVEKTEKAKEQPEKGNGGGVVVGLGCSGFVVSINGNSKRRVARASKRRKAVVAEVNGVGMEEREENKELGCEDKEEEGKIGFLGEWLVEEERKGLFGEGAKLVLEDGLRRVEKGKMEEWEERWRELKKEELGLFIRRQNLIQEQLRFVLDILESEK